MGVASGEVILLPSGRGFLSPWRSFAFVFRAQLTFGE